MTAEMPLDADVIVVGGGPAGATLGAYLGSHGYNAIVLERDIHPRDHVGESLVTSANRILEEIGFFEHMDRHHFIHKPGATWTSYRGKVGLEAKILFADAPQPGINQDYTFHVDRSRFDAALLKFASDRGARVVQGANVLRVTFDEDGRATGVRVRILDREFDLTGRFVVDASGRRCILGKQLGIMEKDPDFNQYAIYSWFSGVKPPTADTSSFIHIHFLPIDRGWVWQIPVYPDVTSVGVVVEKSEFVRAGKDHETFFHDLIGMSKNTRNAMSEASRIRGFQIEGDYSYKMDRFAGDGWLLIGDAARFVDPIFSSGVSVAMHSAKFAFEAIDAAMHGADESEQFRAYDEKVRSGVEIWYEWIKIYYKLQHLFTLLSRNREHAIQMQKLLQGEVFDRDAVQVLDIMKGIVREVERTEGHLLRPMLSPSISLD
jgi:FADH2 O2-dependent halogenase